jgi:SAM-dependent methyltransferase
MTTSRQESNHVVEEVRTVAIDHHDSMAGTFERYYEEMRKDRFHSSFTYGRDKVDRLLDAELRRLPAGAKVLDVGCGTGNYLVRFRDMGLDAHGIEPAPGMIEAAKRLDPTLDIQRGTATSLPFPDATFDFVLAIEVFRYLHLEDTRAGLREMFRVLRPGGKLFVTMVNRYALDGFYLFQRARQRIKGREFDNTNPHCEFFTPAELVREMKAAGASEVETVGRLFAPLRLFYKIQPGLAGKLARLVEDYDDRLCSLPFTVPFAGHLIGIGTRAGGPGGEST